MTKIHPFKLLFILGLLVAISSADAAEGPLRVAGNQRYLERKDGTPFFYLGDTAWELFHRLNREEASEYLANRAKKGFTVIQAVVIAQLGGLTDPNPYGHAPLIDNDPRKPNEDYFKHVDFIVNQAEDLGLHIGMLPTWGNYWKRHNRKPPYLFDVDSAKAYGEFLGKRYKDKPIIWILGGDENPQSEDEKSIVRAIAAGLKKGDGGRNLITFHPRGPGLSSDYFHDEDWLDFNMVQSSHGARDHDNGLFIDHDYARSPAKPTLDGEPRYEHIMVGFYNQGNNPHVRFSDYDSRQAAYWALMAGACGHAYGNNNIWQMWRPGRGPVIEANISWREAMDHPGAFQMKHVRALFESRPFTLLKPCQEMVLDGPKTGGGKIRAACASDKSFAFVYSPRGEAFTLDNRFVNGEKHREAWFDPRYGSTYPFHSPDTVGIQTYTPPSSGIGNDWVLIVDNADKKFPLP